MSWTHGPRASTLCRRGSSMTSPGRGTHALPGAAAVATIALASMLTPLNTSMLPVALPHVQREFGTSASASTWLLTVFALVSAVGHPLAGVHGRSPRPATRAHGGAVHHGRQRARGLGCRDVLAARRAPRRTGARHIHRLPGRCRVTANPQCSGGLRRSAPRRVAGRRGDDRQCRRGVGAMLGGVLIGTASDGAPSFS
jgi:hypothetical protein